MFCPITWDGQWRNVITNVLCSLDKQNSCGITDDVLSFVNRGILSVFANGKIGTNTNFGSKVPQKYKDGICPTALFPIQSDPTWSLNMTVTYFILLPSLLNAGFLLLSRLHLCVGHYTVPPPEGRSREREKKKLKFMNYSLLPVLRKIIWIEVFCTKQ